MRSAALAGFVTLCLVSAATACTGPATAPPAPIPPPTIHRGSAGAYVYPCVHGPARFAPASYSVARPTAPPSYVTDDRGVVNDEPTLVGRLGRRAHPEVYAGLSTARASGRMVVYETRRTGAFESRAREIVGRYAAFSTITFAPTSRSMTALGRLASRLNAHWQQLDQAGVTIAQAGGNLGTGCMDIRVLHLDPRKALPILAITGRYGVDITNADSLAVGT